MASVYSQYNKYLCVYLEGPENKKFSIFSITVEAGIYRILRYTYIANPNLASICAGRTIRDHVNILRVGNEIWKDQNKMTTYKTIGSP
jgi:hypothetical protein